GVAHHALVLGEVVLDVERILPDEILVLQNCRLARALFRSLRHGSSSIRRCRGYYRGERRRASSPVSATPGGPSFPFSLFPIRGMERREGASEGLRDPPLGRPCDREPRTPCEDVRRSCEDRLRPPGAPSVELARSAQALPQCALSAHRPRRSARVTRDDARLAARREKYKKKRVGISFRDYPFKTRTLVKRTIFLLSTVVTLANSASRC